MRKIIYLGFIFLLSSCLSSSVHHSASLATTKKEKPKLVLLITVDQLRADIVDQLRPYFGSNGFNRLIKKGLYFSNAHFAHSTTYTAVGHATIATGTNARGHGIIANDWYSRETHGDMYCVGDSQYKRSPKNLRAPTIGDILMDTYPNQSKVFSISTKDRGAILPGGKNGKAFWYNSKDGTYVTNDYYYESTPKWLEEFNAAKWPNRFRNAWQPKKDTSNLNAEIKKISSTKRPPKGMRKDFPHPLGGKNFYSNLRFSPFSDRLTYLLTKTIMAKEELGRRDATDLLAVSFSASDYIGHSFGSFSKEYEDNLYHLDETLAELFDYVDEHVGLENTLVFLSSDHGNDDIPENFLLQGQDGGRLGPTVFLNDFNMKMKEKYGVDGLIANFWTPGFFLDYRKIEANKLDKRQLRNYLKQLTKEIPSLAKGINHAYTYTWDELYEKPLGNDSIENLIINSFDPKRSGDVMIIPKKNWYLYSKVDEFASMHGSPYPHDTAVPIMVMGPGVPLGQQVDSLVHPRDIAPSIASLLGLSFPPSFTGKPFSALENN